MSFQPPSKLTSRNILQNIRVPYLNTGDLLAQRRSIQVTLICFDLRQLWHAPMVAFT